MHQINNLSYLKYIRNSGISSFLQNSANNLCIDSLKSKDTNLTDIQNLENLEIFIKNSNKDNFKEFRETPIFGKGNSKAKFLLISDPPSREDNIQEKPFAGKSEILLNKMLIAINIKIKDIYMVNVMPWQLLENKEPSNDQILKCLPFIQRYIEIINPKIIILFGSMAAKAILNSNLPFQNIRGKWYKYNSINIDQPIDCIASYNPNDLLKSPSYKTESWKDLQIINRKIIDENL